MKTKKLTELALLTAAALVLYVVELWIPNPIPIPGAKLGLANIITVWAVYNYNARDTLMVLLIRIILGTMFGGSMLTFLYSIAGGLLCLSGMLLLKKIIPKKYIWLASIFGAVLHNIGQTIVACLILGAGMIVYLPFLLAAGCIAGAFTGICAQLVMDRLVHYKRS